jgi:hypothetical protein
MARLWLCILAALAMRLVVAQDVSSTGRTVQCFADPCSVNKVRRIVVWKQHTCLYTHVRTHCLQHQQNTSTASHYHAVCCLVAVTYCCLALLQCPEGSRCVSSYNGGCRHHCVPDGSGPSGWPQPGGGGGSCGACNLACKQVRGRCVLTAAACNKLLDAGYRSVQLDTIQCSGSGMFHVDKPVATGNYQHQLVPLIDVWEARVTAHTANGPLCCCVHCIADMCICSENTMVCSPVCPAAHAPAPFPTITMYRVTGVQ